jgi:hypothetical protein
VCTADRDEVIAAAAKLLLERGIEGIGVDALAKAAGKSSLPVAPWKHASCPLKPLS